MSVCLLQSELAYDKASSGVQSLADIAAFTRQKSFARSPLLDNSTVSLQSVQLNTDIVDNRLARSLDVSDVAELDRTSCRDRQQSECTDDTITPPLSEVSRCSACFNRVI